MGQKVIRGYTNTPGGRVHWKATPEGITDLGFNFFVRIKKVLRRLK